MLPIIRNIFVCTVLACSTINADDAQKITLEYNLLDIYNLAIKNDPQLAAAKSSMLASRERLPQSRALLLPSLTVNGNTQFNTITNNVDGDSDVKRDFNSHGWGATLSQPLFNLSKWHGFDQAKAYSSQAEYKFAYEQQNLILRVSEAYFNVLRSEDNFITSKAEERAVKEQLDQSRERYSVGLIAETDVLEAKATYDTARVVRMTADNQVSVSYENLRTITKKVINSIGKLKKNMPTLKPSPDISEMWVKNAITNNLNLKAAREEVKASEKNVSIKKSGNAPTLEAFASYDYTSSDSNTIKGTSSGAGINTGKGNQTIVGIRVSMNIFSGGEISSRVREARYLMAQSQQNFDKLLLETNASTRNHYNAVISDVERVEARKQTIVSTGSSLKSNQSGYEVGTRNISDVIDAQKKLYEAQKDYLNARYDFIVNTLKLKQLTGTLGPADLEELNNWISFVITDSSVSDFK